VYIFLRIPVRVKCEVKDGKFIGVGDKSKLSFIIGQFKEFVENN